MIWIIDLDGVISSNPDFFRWWTYQLKKKNNNNIVHILTSRNPSRREETTDELRFWGISYDNLHTMPAHLPRGYDEQARWKVERANKIGADIWLDNDFKVYERVCGVELDTPGIERILI